MPMMPTAMTSSAANTSAIVKPRERLNNRRILFLSQPR
jgi:hypothetical protein